jgi:hypothetical protein
MKYVAIVGLLSGIVLSSGFSAFAAEDPKYPGYNNPPVVLYQDWNLIKGSGSKTGTSQSEASGTHDPKYPGAYFDPYVLYRSPDLDRVSSGRSN